MRSPLRLVAQYSGSRLRRELRYGSWHGSQGGPYRRVALFRSEGN
jgi:hypothetical protein